MKPNLKTKPPSTMEDNRWSLQDEVDKLIEETLYLSFPDLGEKSDTITCKEEYGDYQCENALSVRQPTIRPMKPIAVGEKIKKFLRRRRDMVQGVPRVRDFGIVTFKLSDKWIAKSIYKMLKDGIDTWAPKLPVERVIIHIPSIVGEETIDDKLRRTYIKDTLTRMLQYSKVAVSFSGSDLEACKIQEEELNKCFSVEERDGDVVICGKAEGGPKPLIRVKCQEGSNNAFKDLGALWTGLVDKNADWIVCLTPAWRREYIKMCFTAAEHARWIGTDRYYGLSYAGYRTHVELRTLFTLVEQDKAFESRGPTAAMLSECAIKYTYLKNNRLAECTLKLDEMLPKEGNTVLCLLNTHSRVRKITSDSCKDIEKLKKTSKLTLENIEVCENEKGHALGFHLLRFTEVLKQACLSVLPHILCKFLYELSEKFNNYDSSYTSVREVGTAAKTIRLLLCEATLVVMEKSFRLLGITSMLPGNVKSTKLGDKAQSFEYRPYLKQLLCVDEPTDVVTTPVSVARDPPRNSRFELIAVSPEISNRFQKGKFFGYILVSDEYGIRPDGWEPIYRPDCGYVSLINWDWCDAKDMVNHGRVYPGNPSSHHTVALSPSFSIRMELFVESEEKDMCYQLGYRGRELDLSKYEGKDEAAGACRSLIVRGEDLIARLYFILLKDALDTCLEVTFFRDDAADGDPLLVGGEINAFYGKDFPYGDDIIMQGLYKTSLFEPDVECGLRAGPVSLTKSALAAPRDGSLVIEAHLTDVNSGEEIMDGQISFTFEEAISGVKVDSIIGTGCSFEVKVSWKYNKG